MNYLENIVLHYTHEGDPVIGDRIEIIVNNQQFVKDLCYTGALGNRSNPNLYKAKMISDALATIAYQIKQQAIFGIASMEVINGYMRVTFGQNHGKQLDLFTSSNC